MLLITISDGYSFIWHTGDKKPEIWQKKDPFTKEEIPGPNGFRNVHSVCATGDELEYIVARFRNLPMRTSAAGENILSMIWFGDHAQFIVHNL